MFLEDQGIYFLVKYVCMSLEYGVSLVA